MKKIMAVTLALLMCISFTVISYAEAPKTGSFKVSSFNVAGLPSFEAFSGGDVDAESIVSFIANKTMKNQTIIGKYIEGQDYDIFATQEDFFYHDFLAAELKSFNYSTQWQGGVPWGDGTTVFTKDKKMTGEEHIKWDMLSGDGSQEDGADIYSRKGITYVCIEIDDGVYVDFYDIHADANGDEGSQKARTDNFRQLADLVNKKNTGRPVIVTGDFNISSHHQNWDSSGKYFTERLIKKEGFKDAWTELYNAGDYEDFSYWTDTFGPTQAGYWGKWDSVEKFIYKDGDNVSLKCDSFNYNNEVVDENGEHCSDHAMINAKFTYTVTGAADNGENESKTESRLEALFRKILSFITALVDGLSNVKNIFAFQFK